MYIYTHIHTYIYIYRERERYRCAWQPELLGLLLGHDQAEGRAVVEARRVTGGDAADLGFLITM